MDWGKQEREHGVSVFQAYVFSQDLCEKNRFDDILFEPSAANLRDATVAQCDVMSARLDIC